MDPSDNSITQLFEQTLAGQRRCLGKLLSIIEKGGEPADIVAGLAHQNAGNAHVIGITGAPGSGKSSGKYCSKTNKNNKGFLGEDVIFGGVILSEDSWLYADKNGWLVSKESLEFN